MPDVNGQVQPSPDTLMLEGFTILRRDTYRINAKSPRGVEVGLAWRDDGHGNDGAWEFDEVFAGGQLIHIETMADNDIWMVVGDVRLDFHTRRARIATTLELE